MSEDSNTPKTDHSYDGIEEFDNPLPSWWLMTFMGTIIFSFLYFMHYSFGGADTQIQELAQALETMPKTLHKSWNESDLQTRMEGSDKVSLGMGVYSSKCASCHGNEGQGVIGPNLTDSYWLHGKGARTDLMKVISEGVLDKGMPAWAGLMSEDEMIYVAAFIRSIEGTKPQNAKEPQGELVKD